MSLQYGNGAIVIAPSWYVDDATISAPSELSSAPASNLGKMQPKDIWQSTSLSGQYIMVQLPAAINVAIVAL